MAIDPQRLKDLFLAAAEMGSPAQRAAFLDRECGSNAELRQRLAALLRAHDDSGGFLAQPAGDPRATVDPPSSEAEAEATPAADKVGSVLGSYKLLQKLGEGGMGTVWVAEQQQPVKRRVALKVIKPGLDSAQVLHRFEAERQALALMDHTNIAKVFDAGTTPEGRPYFVMELVHGVPITKYCDELNLPIRERLELFVPICQAIQHAHQKGIIHRDVKPSNVLVCLQDGKPVPKVIDFGVAKAMHQPLTESTVYTEFGAVVGTLQYMAPEQAEMSPLGVDTRADVYALGVLLYELLTGTTPLDRKRLRKAALGEVLRILKEEEPPKPSTRLTQSKESLASVAAQRRTEPAKLMKEVRGELDWIVMKCLEKDRTRRYETASGLARDVERHLADEAVEACPPSAGYRLGKLARRYKGPVFAAALLLLALLGGIVGTSWGLVRAERARQAEAQQRQLAEDKEHEARAAAEEERQARAREAEQRQRAEELKKLAEEHKRQAEANERQALEEKRVAEAVRTFLQQDLLRQADATEQANALRHAGGGFEAKENPTIKELLDRAAAALTPAKIEARFPKQREVQASILRTVGDTYRDIGDYGKAVEFLVRASATYRDTLGADHPDTLSTLDNLAGAYKDAGRTADAIALFEQVRDAKRKKLGADHPSTLTTLHNLALAYLDAGRTEDAIALFEEVRDALVKKLGADHPHIFKTLNNLAVAYRKAGRTGEAIVLYEQVRNALVKKLGTDHPDTLTTLGNLALAYRDAGKLEQALPLFQQAATGIEKRHFVHQYAAGIVGNLIDCHERLKQYEQAEAWRRKWLAVVQQREGPRSAAYAGALAGLGRNLLWQHKHTEAEKTLRECLTLRVKLEPDTWSTFNAKSLLGEALLGQKKYADAEPLLKDGYEGMKPRQDQIPPPPRKLRLSEALERLVQLYEANGKKDEAARWRQELEAVEMQK
jgi:serine/threonine protein kinase/tetratricopeptide (TPR) repeat protein